MDNFRNILEAFGSIPVSILLDPFIKQVRVSDGVTFSFNIFDFEFLGIVARHPKLSIKNGIQTLDLLAKPYIYDQVLSGCALQPFMIIANRFKLDSDFSSFMDKLIKVLFFILNNYYLKHSTCLAYIAEM